MDILSKHSTTMRSVAFSVLKSTGPARHARGYGLLTKHVAGKLRCFMHSNVMYFILKLKPSM